MLRFRTGSDAGGVLAGLSLAHAHVFGSTGQPIVGASAQRTGDEIVCDGPLGASAGLYLDCAVRIPGREPTRLALRTCLLPPGDRAYDLVVELARHRVMLLLNKAEEWGLFESDADPALLGAITAARDELVQALADADPRAREDAAGRALLKAIEAGELLASAHARAKLTQRQAGEVHAQAVARAESLSGEEAVGPAPAVRSPDGIGVILPGTPVLGCAVNPARFSETTAAAVARACDFISVPMRWSSLEPEEGRYSFAPTDRWIEWAIRRANLPVVAGPLIDLGAGNPPDWLSIWENDYETLRELVYEHVRHVVTRYRRTVSRWTIVSGLPVNDHFVLSYDRMADLTRICAMVVRRLHPKARVQVDVAHPWGEYTATNRDSIAPDSYLHLLQQAVIDFDAIGLRLIQAPDAPEHDPLAVADLLDLYASFERPIHISVLCAPSAGSGWTPARQAQWLDRMVRLCAGTHYVQSICWGELIDSPDNAIDASGGLLQASGAPKDALASLIAARALIRGDVPEPQQR